MSTSRATTVVKAIKDDLTDWYAGREDISDGDVEVQRWYVPIYDMTSVPMQTKYVTVYEGMTDSERSTRAGNNETHTVQIALQYRFQGNPDIDTTDDLRYELEQIADRYFGQSITYDNVTFRAQEVNYGSVNDPQMTIQQNAWFGVVEMTILKR